MNQPTLTEAEILAIERPEPRLLAYYIISSVVFGPAFFVPLTLNYFRFRTLRYRIDEEGLSMSWGILFRREIHLTYARVQDIHLNSNLVERWLGLARIEIQTASGSSKAEMTIEGVGAYEALRDYLYGKMRGARNLGRPAARAAVAAVSPQPTDTELVAVLRSVAEELRALRQQIGRGAPHGGAHDG